MIWVCAGCTAGVDVSAEGVGVGVPVTPEATVAPDVVLTTPAAPVEPDLVLVTPSAPVEPDFVPRTPAAPLELDADASLTTVDPDTLDAEPLVEPEAAAPIGTVVEAEVLSVAPDVEPITLAAAETEPAVVCPLVVGLTTCPDCDKLATCEAPDDCDVSPKRVVCEVWDVPVTVWDKRLGSEPLGRA